MKGLVEVWPAACGAISLLPWGEKMGVRKRGEIEQREERLVSPASQRPTKHCMWHRDLLGRGRRRPRKRAASEKEVGGPPAC